VTNHQSTSYHVEDENEESLAFTTLPTESGDPTKDYEPVLKAWSTQALPDGQRIDVSVQFSMPDVRGLQAFLNDQFGRGAGAKGNDDANAKYFQDGWVSALREILTLTGAGWTALQIQDWATTQIQARRGETPVYGIDVSQDGTTVVAGTRAPDGVVTIESITRQCPVIYSGVQCNFAEHSSEMGHSFQEPYTPMNDAGAVPPPADAQGATNTPQSASTDQSAAESATGAPTPETAPASTPEKPKRKRRTKLEIAYDDALKAYSESGSNEAAAALNEAHQALVAKDPGNSRVRQGTPAPLVPESERPGELVSGPSFAPEQPQTVGQAWNPAGGPPVAGQVYAPDATGGIPAQAFAPTFQPGQAAEVGPVQVTPEEQQAATAFACPVNSSDGRPCQRPYGHELQTATNPQPKPHVYATVDPSQLGQAPQPQVADPLPWSPEGAGPVFGNYAAPVAPLAFQVPPTPEATAPHPETNLQPPAPAAPFWNPSA
jgi:hypothetical protein